MPASAPASTSASTSSPSPTPRTRTRANPRPLRPIRAITKRSDGRYQAALQVGGVRRFVYGRSRSEVAEKLAGLAAQAGLGGLGGSGSGGRLPAPGRRTLADLLESYFEAIGPTLKPKTLSGYRWLSQRYVTPSLGKVRLSRLEPGQVQALYGQLQARGLRREPARVHRLLHRVFELAALWGWLAENPADRVLAPTYRAPRKEMWDTEQLRRFLEATAQSGDWLWPLWVVAIATGCRPGELLGLRWSDVDLERGTITIRRTAQRLGGQWIETPPKTKAGERTISLPPEAVAALRRQRVQQAEWRLRAGAQWQEQGQETDRNLVFSSQTGGYLGLTSIQRALRRWCRRLDLPPLSPHGLRHLHASLLLQDGLPVTLVSRRLGHSTPGVTMTVYAHALGSADTAAANAISRALALGGRGRRRPGTGTGTDGGAEAGGEGGDEADADADAGWPPARARGPPGTGAPPGQAIPKSQRSL